MIFGILLETILIGCNGTIHEIGILNDFDQNRERNVFRLVVLPVTSSCAKRELSRRVSFCGVSRWSKMPDPSCGPLWARSDGHFSIKDVTVSP